MLDSVWCEQFWLPANVTWPDLVKTDGFYYPDCNCIVFAFFLTPVVAFVRLLVERYVFKPWAIRQGVKVSQVKFIAANDTLERAYRSLANQKPSGNQVKGLAKQLDWSVGQVQKWIYKRRFNDRPSDMAKITECGWKFTYHLSAFTVGTWILWDKPWLWDLNECWVAYPKQNVTRDVAIFYIFQLSYYLSLLMSHWFDVRRKDFVEMLVHHVATILLLSFSWTVNCVRIGTLILVVHDVADLFLEPAKILKYAGYQRVCDVLFLIFSFVWCVSRMIVFPFCLLRSVIFGSAMYFDSFPAFTFLISLLLILQVLHVIWTCFLFKALFRALYVGKIEDTRSSSEMSDSDSLTEEPQ